MKGIHLAFIPVATLASGTIRWEKVNHCLGRDVLSNQLQGNSKFYLIEISKMMIKIYYNYLLKLLEKNVIIADLIA